MRRKLADAHHINNDPWFPHDGLAQTIFNVQYHWLGLPDRDGVSYIFEFKNDGGTSRYNCVPIEVRD